MNIIDVKRFKNSTIVELDMLVDSPERYGKIILNRRWKAAGNSLKEICSISDQELVQIDAKDCDETWIRTQVFVFYYSNDRLSNVEEDEQKGKKEVGRGVAKQEI